jgi:hypothetical protein
MSLKSQVFVGLKRTDSVTSLKNQLVEMQTLIGFEGSAGIAQKKMLKKRRAKPECPLESADVLVISYNVIRR